MAGVRFWIAWLAAAPFAWAVTITPSQLGFAQNLGQYDSGVLFALGEVALYRDKIRFANDLYLRFVGANPSAAVVGLNPLPSRLNLYLGADPQRWRENVPHYATVRYAQLYPGIEAEFNSGTGSYLTDPRMLRLLVAAGANPRQVLLRLETIGSLQWSVKDRWVDVVTPGGPTIGELSAYQPAGTGRSQVAVRFVKVDDSSFRPEVGAYDPALPLLIEFGSAPYAYYGVDARRPRADDSIALAGVARYYPSDFASSAYVATLSPDGSPLFLCLFRNALDELAPAWLAAARNGDTTFARAVRAYIDSAPLPVTPGAPRPLSRRDQPDGWVARFDRSGRLRAATFTGGALGAMAVDEEGTVYFAIEHAVLRWVPGSTQFDFTAPVRSVSSLSANSAGGLAFAAVQSEGQPTTPNAYKRRYEGPWDLYVGVLDRATGNIRMATCVPIIGGTARPSSARSSVALAPGGSVWIGSSVYFDGYPSVANTLVALSADGARELRSESVPASPEVSIDTRGQVWVAVSTFWTNLPTPADASCRAACYPDNNLYVRTFAPGGEPLDATYLPVSGRIVAFDGPDRLFVNPSPSHWLQDELVRVDTTRPAKPGIACAIHTASRQRRTSVAPGGLTTLVGNQLGPLEQVNAALDGSGRLPLTLAGVQVLINQVPAPLVSVQQGLITFYTPDDTPPGAATVEVRRDGALLAGAALTISHPLTLDFALLTADGSGRGPAAALNQDGTVNGPANPAKWGSVVSVFGTGPLPASVSVWVGGYGAQGGAAAVLYSGPAPGSVPGVKQINFRLPGSGNAPAGWVFLWTSAGQYSPGVPTLYVTP